MRITHYLLSMSLLVLLSACTRGHMQPPREVTVENQFALAIPANLKPCTGLHAFAPLQYADEEGGYFLMGIDEPKTEMENLQVQYSLADYAYFVESTVGGAYDTIHISQRDTLEINGLQCHTADVYVALQAEEAQLEVYYHIAVFESPTHFYQLIGWTNRERQGLFRDAARTMDLTFRELPEDMIRIQTASLDKGQ
jgi:hypothetical protein